MPHINDNYFANDSQVTLTNPTNEDFEWKASNKPYKLPAGSTRVFFGRVANLCVKHFVDKMMNDAAIDDPKIEVKMTNYLERQKYADKIIVSEVASHESESNEGVEVDVDEGVDPKDIVDQTEEPATMEDLDKITKTDEELYPEPKKKASNIVKDDEDVKSIDKGSTKEATKSGKDSSTGSSTGDSNSHKVSKGLGKETGSSVKKA